MLWTEPPFGIKGLTVTAVLRLVNPVQVDAEERVGQKSADGGIRQATVDDQHDYDTEQRVPTLSENVRS